MNIYDLKLINCHKCGKHVGEINFDAIVTTPLCAGCAIPISENNYRVPLKTIQNTPLVNVITA